MIMIAIIVMPIIVMPLVMILFVIPIVVVLMIVVRMVMMPMAMVLIVVVVMRICSRRALKSLRQKGEQLRIISQLSHRAEDGYIPNIPNSCHFLSIHRFFHPTSLSNS